MTPPAAADALRHAVQRLTRSGLFAMRQVDEGLAGFHLVVRQAGGSAPAADLEAILDAYIARRLRSITTQEGRTDAPATAR